MLLKHISFLHTFPDFPGFQNNFVVYFYPELNLCLSASHTWSDDDDINCYHSSENYLRCTCFTCEMFYGVDLYNEKESYFYPELNLWLSASHTCSDDDDISMNICFIYIFTLFS